MALRKDRIIAGFVVLALLIAGALWAIHEYRKVCCAFPEPVAPVEEKPKLGLMTSLPLYWPQGADFAALASGQGEIPWQRKIIEQRYEIVPLDTLSPIPGLSESDPETDPLEGLDRLAVIQPRGLSPADNVALDEWVRAGGQLLLVLDPMLTGNYDYPLGDPRRPVDTALIPPVVERWGLAVEFDEDQEFAVGQVRLLQGHVPILMAGFFRVTSVDGGQNECTAEPWDLKIARCEKVGGGTVTLIADAAVLEDYDLGGKDDRKLLNLLDFAFSR